MEEETIAELTDELQQLRIREVEILDKIGRLNEQRAAEGVTVTRAHTNGFAIGDRVLITNKVKKPAAWPNEKTWSESEFRSATVTKVTRLQIHFVTDNEVFTWRAPNNLKKVAP